MIKSTKHSGTSVLELYPPIKGMNNIAPADLLDKLQARDFNGSIDNGRIEATQKFTDTGQTYNKIFTITTNGIRQIYGYTNQGVRNITANTSLNVPVDSYSTSILYDGSILTLAGNKLYIDETPHSTTQHGVLDINYDWEIFYTPNAPIMNMVYFNNYIYTQARHNNENVEMGFYRVSIDGSSVEMLRHIQDMRDTDTWYNFPFVYRGDLYLLDRHTIKLLREDGIVVNNIYQLTHEFSKFYRPFVIDKYLYIFGINLLSEFVIVRINLEDKIEEQLSFHGHQPIDGYFENGKHIVVCYNSLSKGVYKWTLSADGGLSSNSLLGIIEDDYDAFIATTSVAISNGEHFLYYSNPAKNNTKVINIDLYDTTNQFNLNTVPTLDYVIHTAVNDNMESTIYAVGKIIIAKKSHTTLKGILFERDGRVGIASDNMLMYSGVGEPTNWKSGTDSDSVFVEIGYKDGGKIVDVVNAYDVVVFKDNGKTYRLSGSYPDWSANIVFQDIKPVSNVIVYGSNIIFATETGVKEAVVSQSYGDWLLKNVSSSVDLANCRYIHISNIRNSIMYVLSDGIYEFKPDYGSITRLSSFVPKTIVEDDNNIYALKDNRLFKMSAGDSYNYAYGRVLSGERFLIKSVTLYSNGIGTVNVLPHDNPALTYGFTVSGNSQKQKIRQIYTTNIISPKVEVTGDVEVIKILIEYVKIGGHI